MMATYAPRPGSRTERAAIALAESPMSALALSDLLECDQKQIPGILAAALQHGLVTVNKGAKPFMYCLTPPPSGVGEASPLAGRIVQGEASDTAPPPPAPMEPPPTRAPRPRVAPIPRFGLFSDNTLLLEVNGQSLTLDAATTERLIAFLRTAPCFTHPTESLHA